MKEFKSHNSFSEFCRSVTKKNRYFSPPEVEDFLQTVLSTSESRKITFPAGKIFWRAQLGHSWEPHYQDDEYIDDFPAPFPSERMKPLPDKALEGRINPKGIPCLYLSTDRDTALSEVRPWLGSLISLAQFKITRNLTVISCSVKESKHLKHILCYIEEPNPEEREKAVWLDIGRAFSTPVIISDNEADYVPTQIIADLFKVNGFDGILYRSALGKGYNLAIFDLGAAEALNCTLYEVEKVNFEFQQSSNTHFFKKP